MSKAKLPPKRGFISNIIILLFFIIKSTQAKPDYGNFVKILLNILSSTFNSD